MGILEFPRVAKHLPFFDRVSLNCKQCNADNVTYNQTSSCPTKYALAIKPLIGDNWSDQRGRDIQQVVLESKPMLDGVSLHDGDIETIRLMISQSSVSSSYQYSHQRSSYIRNTPLSIETGTHHRHYIIEMLPVPVMHGDYHNK